MENKEQYGYYCIHSGDKIEHSLFNNFLSEEATSLVSKMNHIRWYFLIYNVGKSNFINNKYIPIFEKIKKELYLKNITSFRNTLIKLDKNKKPIFSLSFPSGSIEIGDKLIDINEPNLHNFLTKEDILTLSKNIINDVYNITKKYSYEFYREDELKHEKEEKQKDVNFKNALQSLKNIIKNGK